MPPISKTQLENAALDAQTLEGVINNGPTPGIVATRLGRNIRTLSKVIEDLAATEVGDSAIATLNTRIRGVNFGVICPLVGASSPSTPNYVVASISDNFSTADWILANGSMVSITAPDSVENNNGVFLTIGSVSASSEIFASTGRRLNAGEWVAGRTYILQRRGNNANWRIVTGDVTTEEIRDGRVFYASPAESPSGFNVNIFANFVVTVHNGSAAVRFWRLAGAPANGAETDTHKLDANGRWWVKVTDADVTALAADMNSGLVKRVISNTLSPSGLVVPSNAVTLIVHRNNGALGHSIWRSIGAPADGLETDILKQDGSTPARWWLLCDSSETLNSEIANLQAADTALELDINNKINILKDPSARANGSFAIITGPKNDGSDDILRVGKNGLIFNREGGDTGNGGNGGGLYSDGWALAPDGSFTAQAGINGINAVDRFIDRSDGVRLPVALINGVSRKAVIISGYGQSLADVTPMADPLIWQVPPFPYHGFMLDDMNAIDAGNLRGGMMGWQGVAVQRGSRMINASDGLRNCQSHGAAAFSRLIHWDGKNRRVGLIRSSAWGGNRLRGTTAGTGIWRDSAGNYTQSWINWQGDIEQSYDLLTSAGYEVDAVYILFHHQQADWETPYASYLADFLAMKSEKEALIAAAHPGLKVHWFCGQAGGSGYRTGSYLGGKWQSRLAIVDACKPANGGNNITMVMPEYWARTGVERNGTANTNVIHIQHADRPLWGEHIAHAIHSVENGRSWNCPVMSSASVSGNRVIVNFASEWPLTIDKTFCKVRNDCGFTVNEGAIVISNVTQTGQRQFTLQCATSPAGTSVEYAWRQQDANDTVDDWVISTGAIREAWEAPSLFDPFGRKVIRPALAYRLSL